MADDRLKRLKRIARDEFGVSIVKTDNSKTSQMLLDKLKEELKELESKNTMTRNEMIEFIKENSYIHITHPLFDDDEYIYSDTDGIVRDECGYVFENWDSVTDMWSGINGIRMRTGGMWENGWHIKE